MYTRRLKAVPFIETIGDSEFKTFLSKEFSFKMLASVTVDTTVDVIFAEWRGKNMGSWFRFKNDDNVILEIYSNDYIIKHPKNEEKIQLPLPVTINDFINDMNKFHIQLYWSGFIDINFEPKQYLNINNIRNYYTELLDKMEKSHELL